jgi:hypothetical protein
LAEGRQLISQWINNNNNEEEIVDTIRDMIIIEEIIETIRDMTIINHNDNKITSKTSIEAAEMLPRQNWKQTRFQLFLQATC